MKRVFIARRLRKDMTDAEQKLWSRLRNRQMRGLKFRRQTPIAGFIADFACVKARLVIEIDGGQHSTVNDQPRSEAIGRAGYLVIRFWNDAVLNDIDAVMDEIDKMLAATGV
jgi:very-short-patch-repair endonuclease